MGYSTCLEVFPLQSNKILFNGICHIILIEVHVCAKSFSLCHSESLWVVSHEGAQLIYVLQFLIHFI